MRLHSKMITEGLAYLRYKRQFNLVVDEYNKCDILGVNSNIDTLEIEVKTSIADLKNDIKKTKHSYYNVDTSKKFKPNKFFFMVPLDIYEKALIYINETFPYAGIMTYEPGLNKRHKFKTNIYVKKHAKSLINKKLTEKQYIDIQKRVVSSMIIAKLKLI